MSAKAKAAITKYSGEYFARLGGGAFDSFGKFAYGKIAKSGKRTIMRATAAELVAQRADAKPIYDAWIKKTKDGALKYATLVKILEDIRAGK